MQCYTWRVCVSSGNIETVFIKMEKGPTIGVVYRPPGSSVKTFVKEVEDVLIETSRMHCKHTVVVGDSNIYLSSDT